MLQEIARIRVTLRDVVDAPPGVRSAKLAELAGNERRRTVMLLEDQRVTLFPARVLRYVPNPPSGDISGPASLIARYERLPLLPRASRSAEAAALVHDLEAGAWTLSRSTYEWYRDELDYFVPDDRGVPLWEEAVHSVRAASRARADQGGEQVIWIDESHPVLLVWRSGHAAAVALAVTGRHVADRWLRAERGFDARHRNRRCPSLPPTAARRSPHATHRLVRRIRMAHDNGRPTGGPAWVQREDNRSLDGSSRVNAEDLPREPCVPLRPRPLAAPGTE